MGKFTENLTTGLWEYTEGTVRKTLKWILTDPENATQNGNRAIADLDVLPPPDIYRMWARHEWLRVGAILKAQNKPYRHVGGFVFTWSSKKAAQLAAPHQPIPNINQIENCITTLCDLDRTGHTARRGGVFGWAIDKTVGPGKDTWIINAIGYYPGVEEARRMLQNMHLKMSQDRGQLRTQLYFAFLCWGMLPVTVPLDESSLAELEPTLKTLFPADLEKLLDKAEESLKPSKAVETEDVASDIELDAWNAIDKVMDSKQFKGISNPAHTKTNEVLKALTKKVGKKQANLGLLVIYAMEIFEKIKKKSGEDMNPDNASERVEQVHKELAKKFGEAKANAWRLRWERECKKVGAAL